MVIEDVIQFFGSNIECFEDLKSCEFITFRHQSLMGELSYYQWPGFPHTLLVILHGK